MITRNDVIVNLFVSSPLLVLKPFRVLGRMNIGPLLCQPRSVMTPTASKRLCLLDVSLVAHVVDRGASCCMTTL